MNIQQINDAIEQYNNGNFDIDPFKLARDDSDEVIEENEDFIHFVKDGKEYEIVHTQLTRYPHHVMSLREYVRED